MASGLGPPGTLSGTDALDQPPPNQALDTGMNSGLPPLGRPGGPTPGGPGGLGATLASSTLPPDVLTGMMQAATKIASDLNSFAQMTPDLAADWAAVQDALSHAMSKVLMAGAGPTSPTAVGPGFPGGGIDRGGQPLASGGGV